MDVAMKPAFLSAAAHVSKLAHVFALTAAVLMLVWVLHFRDGVHLHSDNKDLIFNVHPLVMLLGFILVIGEGIMTYKMLPMVRSAQKLIHMMLQLVALTLGIFGIYATFKYHRESEIPDMTSLHSWLGIVTICLFGLQWVFGFMFFWFPGAPPATRQMIRPLHASGGLAIFLMTVCSALTGLVQMDDTMSATEMRVINFTGLFILLFGLTVSIAAAIPTRLI